MPRHRAQKWPDQEYLVSFVYCFILYFGKYFRINVFFLLNLYILIQNSAKYLYFFCSYRSSHRAHKRLSYVPALIVRELETFFWWPRLEKLNIFPTLHLVSLLSSVRPKLRFRLRPPSAKKTTFDFGQNGPKFWPKSKFQNCAFNWPEFIKKESVYLLA